MPQISLHSPVGDITLSEDNGAIVSVDWGWGSIQEVTSLLSEAREQMQAYFDGRAFSFDIPLAPNGTVYQRNVWQALQAIPYGQTRPYAEIAKIAGGCARAVGSANRANPMPIIIPCHRVVASHGLGGYSGGDGIATKRFLLALEQRHSSTARSPEAAWRTQ